MYSKMIRAEKTKLQKLRTLAEFVSPLAIGVAKAGPRLNLIRITDVVGISLFLGATYATRRKTWGKSQPKKTPAFRSESFRVISMAVLLSGPWLSINM